MTFPNLRFAYESADFAFDLQGVFVSTSGAPLLRLCHLYSMLMLTLSFLTFHKHIARHKSGGMYIVSVLYCLTAGAMVLTMLGIARTDRDDINFLLSVTVVSVWILLVFAVHRGESTIRITGRDYVLQKLGEPYILINNKGGFLDANDAAMHLFPELTQLRTGTNLARVPEIPTQITASEDKLNIRILIDGETRHYHVSHTPLYTDKIMLGKGIMLFDITEQTELLSATKRLAQRDTLTGLYNRNAFLRMASQDYAMVRHGKYDASVVVCEVDNFSSITENFGYAAGDDVIVKVAKIITARLRRTDIAARYWNEQFTLWLPSTPYENAVGVAESLQKLISDTRIMTQHVSLSVKIIFGVAYAAIPTPPENDEKGESNHIEHHENEMLKLTDLIKQADSELAKIRTSNR